MDFDNDQELITPNVSKNYIVINTTGAVGVPAGTTAQRPSTPSTGFFRFNSTTSKIEWWDGAAWTSPGSGWGLTGNAATTAGTNFVGTTDDVDVVLKRFSIQSGRLFSASTGNSTFGTGSLLTVTGTNNTSIGSTSLSILTSGSNNTTLGFNTGSALTTQLKNTLIGSSAGIALTSANNTIIGATTAAVLTTGANNTIIGSNVVNNITGTALVAADTGVVILADGLGNVRVQAESVNGVVSVAYHKDISKTVATLPSAATVGVGVTSFVTDALSPVAGSTVVGSGTIKLPVYSDGTNWIAMSGSPDILSPFLLMGA